jgi:hypothetical protein
MARRIPIKAGIAAKDSALPLTQQNPYWILVTFAYLVNDTFERGRMSSPPQAGFRVVSRADVENNSRQTVGLLFDMEIKNWSLSSSKASHIHTLNLQMFNTDGTLSLLEWLNAGDWCMFWSFRDRATYEKIRGRLIAQHGVVPWTADRDNGSSTDDHASMVTGWRDGLKFVGRLQAPRHHEFRQSDGSYDVGYSLQAHAFTELESTIYYDDVIRFKYPNAIEFFHDLGIGLDKFLRAEEGKGFVNTNVTIPALTQILLGKGPGVLSKDKGNTEMRPSSQRASIEDSPNVQFEIPEAVGKILRPLSSNVPKYYSDILTQFVGDQTYGGNPKETSPDFLNPEVETDDVTGSIFYTKRALVDYFPPNPLDFKGKSVWSILKTYVNEPINEIYTVMKPHPIHGGLTPTLVVRRIPYSSDTYQKSESSLRAVPFSELPRWIIPYSLMLGYDMGKDDAARINYVHITPSTMPSQTPTVNEQLVRLQSPPVVNKVDVMRHGLRTYITPVAGFANPTAESEDSNISRRYTEFMADILMDGHLRYNGTLTTVGLQEPVQPGDNLEFNGILFHIEAVNHSGGISSDGSKTFQTNLQISHGMPLAVTKGVGGMDTLVRDAPAPKNTTDSQTKVKNSKKKSRKQQEQDEAKRFESEKKRIEEALAKYRDPPEDDIRKLRNERAELTQQGLVGAKTRVERE